VHNEPDPIATREELDAVGYRYPNPRRNSQGTRIRQDHGGNWFHFAIPIPTNMGPHSDLEYEEVFIAGSINEQAEITKVHVWSGGVPEASRIQKAENFAPDIRGRDFGPLIGIQGTPDKSLAICIYAEFEPGGEITFGRAGVRFTAEAPD
jgi:hypothetical protein